MGIANCFWRPHSITILFFKAQHNRVLAKNPCRLLVKSLPVWAIWFAAFGYFLVVSVAVQFLPLHCLLIARKSRADSSLLAALPFLFMV